MLHKILSNPTNVLLLVILGFATFHTIFRYITVKGDSLNEKLKLRWTALEAVTVTITVYIWSQFLGAIPLLVLFGDKAIKQETLLIKFLTALFIDAAAVGLVFLFLRRRRAKAFDIGLKRPLLRDLGYVLVGYGVYFVTYLTSVQALSGLPGFKVEQKQELGFTPGISGSSLWLVFATLVILPPIAEEIIVRGFLYTGLRSKFKMLPAALITSLIFASAHLQAGSGNPLLWIAALDTFVLSMVLVYLREKTGSLAASMGLHALKNFIAFAALFIFKIT